MLRPWMLPRPPRMLPRAPRLPRLTPAMTLAIALAVAVAAGASRGAAAAGAPAAPRSGQGPAAAPSSAPGTTPPAAGPNATARSTGAGPDAAPSDADATEGAPPAVPLDVTAGWLDNGRGDRVRTVASRPRLALRTEKLPAILVVGGLNCEPLAPARSGGTATEMLDELAARSGAVMLRVEKPGIGGGQGTACAETDFQRELAGYQAGLRTLAAMPGVDRNRIFLLGLDNGGAIAPLVAAGVPVAGYVVAGVWVKTWYEHAIESERRRLRLEGKAPGEVNDRMRLAVQFYDLYLNGGKTPGEVLRERPDLAPAWEGGADLNHQHGRPAATFIQLQQLNLAAAWSGVREPVLVIHGEYDWIMGREDHEMIAALVNHHRPGAARFVEVPQMDHLFGRQDSAAEAFHKAGEGDPAGDVVELILEWLRLAEKAAGGA